MSRLFDNRIYLLFWLMVIFGGGCAVYSTDSIDPVKKAVEGAARSPENRLRDVHRHPLETLRFCEVEADMTVVEIWPGKGWYTEILAPLLAAEGLFYAAHFNPDSKVKFFQQSVKQFTEKLAAQPQYYSLVRQTVLEPPLMLDIAPKGSADRVLTFRNVHNWMKSGTADAVFKAMYRALKPGGQLCVIEHRGDPDTPQDPWANSGYVTEDTVIELAELAGFELIERSEINANTLDNRLHPEGVWTLPPSLRMGEKDKEKYLAIGESDRMTILFLKPVE